MRPGRRRLWLQFACAVALCSGGFWYVAKHPQVLHLPIWKTREIDRRQAVLRWIWASVEKYAQAHSGHAPASIAQAINEDPESWRDNPSMADAVALDRQTFRVIERAVLLPDVPNPKGGRFRWVLAVLLPDEGLFAPIQDDYIYWYTNETFGNMATMGDAELILGSDVVDSIIQRHREVVGSMKPGRREKRDGQISGHKGV